MGCRRSPRSCVVGLRKVYGSVSRIPAVSVQWKPLLETGVVYARPLPPAPCYSRGNQTREILQGRYDGLRLNPARRLGDGTLR